MTVPDLLLDPSIKLWVLLPISIVMVLVGVLRMYIQQLLTPTPRLQGSSQVKEQQHLTRLRHFQRNRHTCSSRGEYNSRVDSLCSQYSKENIKNYIFIKPESDQANPLFGAGANEMLWDMMKGNLAQYLPQTIIMWWVNYFFKGYVSMRLPFSLTSNFKAMLQTSINTTDLDASYVSGISWYFVNLIGLQSIYGLVFQDEDMVTKMMDQVQGSAMNNMGNQMMGGMGQPKAEDIFAKELENLKLTSWNGCLVGVEERFLTKYDK